MTRDADRACVFPGRFQPFHNSHAAGIQHAASIYERVVVAISNAHISHTARDPFTGGERYKMIDTWARATSVRDQLDIIPVPVNDEPTSWVATIRATSPGFRDVYTRSAWTEALFAYWGIPNCKALFTGNPQSASEIRALIADGGNWRPLLPEAVAEVLDACGGVERVARLYAGRNHRLGDSADEDQPAGDK